jgi:signal transduction histidine kinase
LRTERALEERATALARSNRDLDAFAYVASHDLKAPLRAMEQLTGFALEDAGDALPEKSRQDLQLVQQRSRRLMGMLDGLLDYARIGRDEGAASLIDLGAVLAELAELYVPAERFSLEIPDDLPPIQAPRAAVELVFRNLLMNVVKHHDQDRGHIRIGWRAGDGYLHLTVADDGPGVPLTHREKVFELFQTLGRHDEVVASGMGLALVKRTVETHGGTVTLCAGEGRGATFEVAWPQRRSGETVAWEELASGNVLLG